MVALVANGEQTFLDLNGDPLSAGKVYFYEPGTTTPKTTWHDPGQAAGNPNPVILDQAGRAIIWGDGRYRQVVQNQFGTVQWDVETDTGGGGGTVVGDQTIQGNQTITQNLTVNGTSTLNGGATVNNGLTVNGTENVNGDEHVSGALSAGSLSTGSGPITGGSIIANGGLAVNNGEMDANHGAVITAAPGQLDALVTNGAITINDQTHPPASTFLEGHKIFVNASTSGQDPGIGFSTPGVEMGMWVGMQSGVGYLLFGGTAGGDGQTILMELDSSGNLRVHGTVTAPSLAALAEDVRVAKAELDALKAEVAALRAAPPQPAPSA